MIRTRLNHELQIEAILEDLEIVRIVLSRLDGTLRLSYSLGGTQQDTLEAQIAGLNNKVLIMCVKESSTSDHHVWLAPQHALTITSALTPGESSGTFDKAPSEPTELSCQGPEARR